MLRIAIELPVDVAVVENPIKGFSERRLKAAFFNLKIFKKELPKSKFWAALFCVLTGRKITEKREKRCAFSNIHTFVCLCAKNRRKSKLSADIFQK